MGEFTESDGRRNWRMVDQTIAADDGVISKAECQQRCEEHDECIGMTWGPTPGNYEEPGEETYCKLFKNGFVEYTASQCNIDYHAAYAANYFQNPDIRRDQTCEGITDCCYVHAADYCEECEHAHDDASGVAWRPKSNRLYSEI